MPAHPCYWKARIGPAGIHLFSRTTGLNLLVDEVKFPPSRWAAAPRFVSIALTNACDLSCAYCYAPKNPATLAFTCLVGWLHELDRNGCLGVGFGGGEPTLYRKFPELCRYAAQETGLTVTFTTHAHRLQEKLVSQLAGNVHFFRVSMDGIGATYETLRGRSFEAFCRRLQQVRTLAPFGINYVVNARTLPELTAATALAAEVGAVEFLLLPEQPTRHRPGIDGQTFQELCRWVRLYRGAVPLTISEDRADGLPACDPLVPETGLRAYAHINAAGVLKRSSFSGNGVVIGHDGVMSALDRLQTHDEGASHETVVRLRI